MATILIVDDDSALREGLAEAIADLGHATIEAGAGAAALELLRERRIDAVLLDLRMPGTDGMEVLRRIQLLPQAPPVAILTAAATVGNTIEAMRLGAADHLTKPVGPDDLAALLSRMLQRAPSLPRALPDTPPEAEPDAFIGTSAAMRTIQKSIGLLADSTTSVLIVGETGTGKEVVARSIHRYGSRAKHPFVAVNCAAIPSDLLESQLFGHTRGSFTGAIADRSGSFREADRGTLLLDEIGDMDLAMQAKLLRVLQERQVTPVGGKPTPIDVRIISATHRDLTCAVKGGRFREDLFYRLRVVPIALPPLRERLVDLLPLAEHFLILAAAGGTPRRLAPDAAARLLAHPWPGNVRELRNAMERVATLVRQPVLSAADFDFLEPRPSAPQTDWLRGELPEAVARLEIEMIRRALGACAGNRAEAARRLGISRQLLYDKLRRYDLSDG